MTELATALLALLTTLVAALVYVVKKGDKRQTTLIQTLISAVESFQRFECQIPAVHAEMVGDMKSIASDLRRALEILDRIDQRTLEWQTRNQKSQNRT